VRTIERLIAERGSANEHHVVMSRDPMVTACDFVTKTTQRASQLARRSIGQNSRARVRWPAASGNGQWRTPPPHSIGRRGCEHQQVAMVDERERETSGHHVLHQDGKASV